MTDSLKINPTSAKIKSTAKEEKGRKQEKFQDHQDLVAIPPILPTLFTPDSLSSHKKVILVGDSACGKTALIERFCNGLFPEEHAPTTSRSHTKAIQVDKRKFSLNIVDTGGGTGADKDHDILRPLNYSHVSVILMCFSIVNPDSLENVQGKWVVEVKHFCPGLPIVLVGLKKDHRHDINISKHLHSINKSPVTLEKGEAVMKEIGAKCYLECSALTQEGVKEIFDCAARDGIKVPMKKKLGLVKSIGNLLSSSII